jgi:predicted protein tyrosine phosphatase
MARRKVPTMVEDIGNASILLTCRRPECRHEFRKYGAWLEKNRMVPCPKCGEVIVFSDGELIKLFGDHVRHLRGVLERLRAGQG